VTDVVVDEEDVAVDSADKDATGGEPASSRIPLPITKPTGSTAARGTKLRRNSSPCWRRRRTWRRPWRYRDQPVQALE
jgi:hypothetical protein